MARGVAYFPGWTLTVSEMKLARDAKPDHYGVIVRCAACRADRPVDLDALIIFALLAPYWP